MISLKNIKKVQLLQKNSGMQSQGCFDMKTGNTRYRISWLGKVILQVEVYKNWDIMTDCKTLWRDATKKDV